MKNVSNYYHDKVPIWNGGVRGRVGEGVGGYFEQLLAALMMLLQLWVGGMNKTWFLMEMMIFYFQYFTFKLLIFALDKAHYCCSLNPAVACNLNLI